MDGSEDDALWPESEEDSEASEDPFADDDSDSEIKDFNAIESEDPDCYLTDGAK